MISRCPVPYGLGDFAAAIVALCRNRLPSPDGLSPVVGAGDLFWTGSGRQALCLILRALGFPPGAGVALPLFGSSTVATSIAAAGLTPVFVDCDERTFTIDAGEVARVRKRVSCVVVEHLFGYAADMDLILEAAAPLPVIEDTAHAMLSLLDGRMLGTIGIASFYSFATTKYLPAGGGGLIACNDSALAVRLQPLKDALRCPGRIEGFRRATLQLAKAAVFSDALYGTVGSFARSCVEDYALLDPQLNQDGIAPASAAAALVQVAKFPERVRRQRANSLRLLALLDDIEDIVLPYERPGGRYNYHYFAVLVRDREERDSVRARMFDLGIDTSRLHFNAVERAARHGYRGGCPVSESIADRILTLPNHAGLSEGQMDRVATAFRISLARHRASRGAVLEGVCV